jgi:hypothetical protein
MPILPQCETPIGDVIMMKSMRALVVYLTLLVLLALSIGAGVIASDWPHWCSRWHWCSTNWPRHR